MKRAGFTLIEMITVMAVIVILTSLVLSINSYVQRKSAMSRAQGEIQAMSTFITNYETDNGGVPRGDETDKLDPITSGAPVGSKDYEKANQTLYIALSGDTQLNFRPVEKSYAQDFFRPERIHFEDPKAKERKVKYIQDPFGNCYGYSTLGALVEEKFLDALKKTPTKADRKTFASKGGGVGFNSTFDLWSTGGLNSNTPSELDRKKWVKNW